MIQKTKKKVNPNAPIKPWASLITWAMLNLIWTAMLPIGTPHPVLSEDSGHRENYEMTVPNMMGAELPFDINCEFYTAYSEHKNTIITWELWEVGAKEREDSGEWGDDPSAPIPVPTRNWSGAFNEPCGDEGGVIYPGEYILEIRFYNENGTRIGWEEATRIVDGDFTMKYWIYEPHSIEGYVAANVLGVIILMSDQTIRRRKRRKLLARKILPLHKQRHKEEWDSLHESMDDGHTTSVESFDIELGATSESAREEMRKRFEESTEDEEISTEVPDEAVSHDEKLGKGSISGLEGDAKVASDIRTVKDLWRQIEEDEI
ncbi:MAG: hypothetical protein HOE69_04830 [Euryarchaeota archaeon]|jgi:hypothetical protein|nr:hypothetical protein [Euryarchaeota archaeon]